MRRPLWLLLALGLSAGAAAELHELVDEAVLERIAAEVSGEMAKRHLDEITLHHRMRASDGFEAATAHVVDTLSDYGLDVVGRLEFAADGETLYGTQKSRPVWRVGGAELWELEAVDGRWVRRRRLGHWDSVPLSLAQDSLSADVTAAVVDVGAGTSPADYEGVDVTGKLVLTSSQPGAIVDRAVGELGAVGIVSYAPNQRSAWWKEDERLVRWGHLSSFPRTESFGFMISLGEARALRERLAAGEEVRFHARVDASHEQGRYSFATAAIVGRDHERDHEEIVLTCHLDHPRPGANDNASGCAAILEVARALHTLVSSGRLARPARTIRFLWPAEIEGSIMYLAEHEDTSRLKANIHLDMVGGSPATKAVFRISGGPLSLPTFIADVGFEIGRFVNAHTEAYASGADTDFPLVAGDGGKEPLLALFEGLDMGSDHDVFREGSWQIPGLYLHDWPDRYIHTNFDTAAMIDPTKLERSAFIAAVAAWYLADLSADDVPALLALLRRNALARGSELLEISAGLGAADAAATARVHFEAERRRVHSVEAFAPLGEDAHAAAAAWIDSLQAMLVPSAAGGARGRDTTVYARNPDVRGPMHAFGYSYLDDRYGAGRAAALRLPAYRGPRGSGGEYAYEALNLVDGRRTVSDIRDWLTAELGPVPVEFVAEYLSALEEIGVLVLER